ncbi:hypothetical protein GCK72_022919 [Caenorhabditis remanei]|uniref:F-box domain-containing protein n=1 Tax=Caenorhabditis remanei TaxID=31234 RepID=A0A6A5FV96_CAERE|nr:hypothetical protein GCK72_022919 [Caenorhabditis remanei]KAF1746463.1 hypothetical protein GCK72_022919 [Caenorhabditis remanei]
MSNVLSYPSLKCVIEFLEPMKRMHIAIRSSSLRQYEKSIPIRIESLGIGENYMELNKRVVEIDTDNELNFEYKRKPICKRRFPTEVTPQEAFHKVMISYIGKRLTDHVNKLVFNNLLSVLNLP